MTPTVTCPHCGGTDVVEGSLRTGSIEVRFWPKHVKSFWTFHNGVRTLTYACLGCGSVVTVLEPEDLRRLIGKDPEGGSAAT